MQYALISIKDKMLLLSAHEMQALDEHLESIADMDSPQEDTHPYHLCYGSYMPQIGTNAAKAIEDFQAARDHWLGSIENDKCHIIAFHDAQEFEVQHIGNAIRIPFAALIQASEAIIEKIGNKSSVQSVTGFLRYQDMSPSTNLLNRPGIIALKGLEKRLKVNPLNLQNWRESIDHRRAERAALTIK